MRKNIEKMLYDYNQLNLSWDIEAMLEVNKVGVLLEDINSEDCIESLIVIMVNGMCSKDVEKIKKFLSRYVNAYGSINPVRMFVMYDLMYKHNFISEEKVHEQKIHKLLLNSGYKQEEYTREEKLKIVKNNYEYAIRVYMKAGYRIDEIMKMDFKYFDIINDFVIREHEERLNDMMLLAHRTGLLSGIGFINLKNYPESAEKIRLRPLTEDEIIDKKKEEARQFQTSINRQLKYKEDEVDG